MKKVKVILSDEEVKKTLKIREVIGIVEEGFRKKGLGLVDLPPKMGPKLNIPGAFAESMPVAVFKEKQRSKEAKRQREVLEIFGIKWQSAYASNLDKGIPYLNNLVILNEAKCGLPIAIFSGNWITALRTGGVSAVCAKYLAPRRQDITIGIFGLGVQAYVHVLAFKAIFKNPRFFLFNHDEMWLRNFLKKFPSENFFISNNFHEVVQNSDVVLTATTFPPRISPYIFGDDLKEDVLLLPLEYGTRIHPGVYKLLNEVYTDDIPQYKLKSKLRNYFPPNGPLVSKEVGMLVAKGYKRSQQVQRILVFNLGIALFDILVAHLFLKKSEDKNV